jgi:hypothetical protein
MKKSEKILQQNGIQEGISWTKRKTIENSILLKHLIDNDLKHMWRLILLIMGLIAGLYAKFFIGG